MSSVSRAYVGQQPWIQNATVKENILFGQNPVDQGDKWYKEVRGNVLVLLKKCPKRITYFARSKYPILTQPGM